MLLLHQRYQALKLIGQGGFGRTFLAVDAGKPSKPRCVIKQFFPVGAGLVSAQGTTNAQKAAELFRQEAKRLKELGRHPQIPALLTHVEQDQQQYLVQEFIEGQNLAQELTEEGPFNEIQIRQLLRSLLPVLKFVHDHQVIHRDIKPANIIRRNVPIPSYSSQKPKSQLVLVDFGAAKFATGTALIQTGTTIGSAEYTAPEQMRGKAVFASDLYSLGVTCIHLLTQLSPFDLFDSSEATWVWRDFLRSPVSNSLGQVLDKLLQNATKRRYKAAAEVLRDLNSLPTQSLRKTIPIREIPVKPTAPPSTAQSTQSTSTSNPQTSPWFRREPLEEYPAQTQPIFPFEASTEAPIEPVAHQQNLPDTAPLHSRQDAALRAILATFMIFASGTMLRLATSSWHEAELSRRELPSTLSPTDDSLLLPQLKSSNSEFLDTVLPLRTLPESDLVLSLAMSPDGETLVSGSAGSEDATANSSEKSLSYAAKNSHHNQIKVWDLPTGTLRYTLSTQYPVWSVAISPDSQILVTSTTNVSPLAQIIPEGKGSDRGSIQIWNLHTGELLRTIPKSADDGMFLAVSPDGTTLASGANESIKLWNLRTGDLIRTLEASASGVNSVVFSQDGQTLASTGFDGRIKIWNPRTGDLIRTLEGEPGSIAAIAINPDGQTLVSGVMNGAFGSISTWDLRTGELIHTFSPPDAVVSVAISPNGKTFATGSWDSTTGIIRIWNLETGKLLHSLVAHRSVVDSLMFSPDGKTLASGSLDETIKLWQVQP